MAKTKAASWQKFQRRQITPELCEDLTALIAGGATLKQAARAAGVPPGILRRWLAEGADQVHEIYESDVLTGPPAWEGMLFLAVEKAIGERGAELVEEILKAGKDDEWRSRAWVLERLEADEFGDKKQLEVSGPEGAPIALEGRAVVGLADVVAIARQLGLGDRLGLDAGDSRRELAAASDVLPDPADSERPPGDLSDAA